MVKGLKSISGFCYRYYHPAGALLLRVFKSLSLDLKASGIYIHPEVYASITAFIQLLLLTPSAISLSLLYAKHIAHLNIQVSDLVLCFIALLPLSIALVIVGAPKIIAGSFSSGLEAEVPYMSVYVSVMATGGVPPFTSLKRLSMVSLLPRIRKLSGRITLLVDALGRDPISVMEEAADTVPSRSFRELLRGYTSTLRMGGDVVSYLLRKTEMILKEGAVKIRIIGERISGLMEAYISVSVLMALGIYVIYAMSLGMASMYSTFSFSMEQFTLFSYVLMPLLSLIFIYLADALQPKYPVTDYRPYKILLASTPIFMFTLTSLFLAFNIPELKLLPFIGFSNSLLEGLLASLGMRGYEPAIGLATSLILSTIPSAIADVKYSYERRGINEDLGVFLRDLVEARKTGLPLEECVRILSGRSYGRFTRHLKTMARMIGWGVPLSRVYEKLSRDIKSWTALINLYLLADTIEVGGGSSETLEVMARFAEDVNAIEREKRSVLKPLLFIPYIGALILIFSTIILLIYQKSLASMARMAFSYYSFTSTLLPPLIIHMYLMGLVAGKVSSGTISSGFKHSILLCIVGLIAMWLSPTISIQMGW